MTRIQTFNLNSKFFIRHHNFEGEINELDRPGPISDFEWQVKFLRMDNGFRLVAFKSLSPAGFHLRHKGFRLVLERPDGSDQFKQDNAFREVPPLVGDPNAGWRSYQAFQQEFSDRFIGHKTFHLWLRDRAEPGMAADSTFRLVDRIDD
ncbi:AbfB domain-containing protein [Streptomyces sp. NPDC050803]|uniref:AbfB domain-containing protein n=1 Tax=unclassified Streptomyces TaxID=2593676 RepID=UPI0034488324